MGKKHEQDLRIVQGVVDAQLAERDAEIAQLRQQVDAWQATGNAIMQCAVGRETPLSDSDVCGEINALRQQVAEAKRQWDNVRHDNAKLLRQLTENRHAYKRLHDDMEDVNRHNTELRQQVAELQAWKSSVPVDALNRTYMYSTYMVSAANAVGYTPALYDEDCAIVGAWFDAMTPD